MVLPEIKLLRSMADSSGSPSFVMSESAIGPEDSVSVVGGHQGGTATLLSLTEHDIAAVLTNVGFSRYASLCLSVPLTGRALSNCREGDLEEIGIKFRPHRLSIMDLIKNYVDEGVPAELLERRDGGDGSSASVASAASGGTSSAACSDCSQPSWLTEAQQALDQAEGEATSEIPPWLTQAQAQLGSTQIVDPVSPGRGTLSGGCAASSQPSVASGLSERQRVRLEALAAAADGGTAAGRTVVLPKAAAAGGDAGGRHAIIEVHYAADRGTIRVMPANAPYVIGRSGSGLDLSLAEPHISAKQCVLLPPDAASTSWKLVDNSTNGTFINGELVGKGASISLNPGDRLQFGRRDAFPCATFTLPADSAAAGSASGAAASWSASAWECASSSSCSPAEPLIH